MIFKKILIAVFLLSVFFLNPEQALSRYAECDSCGYCKNQSTIPDNWARCAECIYPHIVERPIDNSRALRNLTLKIDTNEQSSNFNRPPKPLGGRFYTQLGCIGLGSGIDSFSAEGSGGVIASFILQNLIFPIVGTLAFVTIIFGAFTLLTAQGDIYKIQQGKRLIASSLVGVTFTLSIVLILNTIGSDILRLPQTELGDVITVKAEAVNCAPSAPARAQQTPCPNLELQIKEGDRIIKKMVSGELPENTKDVVFNTGMNFDIDVHQFVIYFTDDYNNLTEDKNVKIEEVTLSKTDKTILKCNSFNYYSADYSKSFFMNWGGTSNNKYRYPAECTDWGNQQQ